MELTDDHSGSSRFSVTDLWLARQAVSAGRLEQRHTALDHHHQSPERRRVTLRRRHRSPHGANQTSTIHVDGVANVTGTTTATSTYSGRWRLGYGALPTGSACPRAPTSKAPSTTPPSTPADCPPLRSARTSRLSRTVRRRHRHAPLSARRAATADAARGSRHRARPTERSVRERMRRSTAGFRGGRRR